MKTTTDHRAYSLFMSQEDSRSLEVHPDVFEALHAMIGNGTKTDGQVIIQIAGGSITDVKVHASVRVFRHSGLKVCVSR